MADKHKASLTTKFFIGGVVILALFLAGLIPKILNNRRLNDEAKKTTGSLPEVEVAMPRLAEPDKIVLPGNVDAILKTSTQSRTTGYVAKLYVDIGSRVNAGQVLADIQSPDVDQQLSQAAYQTDQSRATVGQSLADVDRLRAGVFQARATVSQQQAVVIQSTAGVDAAKANKEQAESNLKVSQAKLADSDQQVLVQKAALNQAKANYNLALANYKREHLLLEEGFVSQQDFDTAEAALKVANAAVNSADANVQSAIADDRSAQETVHASRQAVLSAQASEDAAMANLKASRANLESTVQALSASKSSLTSGQETVKANLGALGASVANTKRYQVMTSFEHVVAPFAGIITARNIDVGSLVSPGQITATDSTSTTPSTGLFGIARIDVLRIYVDLPQSDYQWAPPGTHVAVLVRELPNQQFDGVVHQTSGALDETTRTLQTEVRIKNPKSVLLPGMYAQVVFTPGSVRELRIPANSILVDARGTHAFVIDAGNRVHMRKIVIGRDYGTEAEVVSGLQAGERLVANASDNMEEGQKVQIIQPKENPKS